MPGPGPRTESMDGNTPRPGAPPPARHDLLRLALMTAGRQVRASLEDLEGFPPARDNLVRFCFAELLPHLEADEGWLVAARHHVESRLLIDAIRSEARAMTAAVYELAAVTGPCEAVAATRVLHAFLAAHDHHEQLLVSAGVRPSEGISTASAGNDVAPAGRGPSPAAWSRSQNRAAD